jgi:hypothetical protein
MLYHPIRRRRRRAIRRARRGFTAGWIELAFVIFVIHAVLSAH